MKKIAIIGAGEFQNPLILKAKKLGYETHVFAWKDGAIGEKNADYFYPISIIEKEKIYKKCINICPSAIISIASDLAAITVNYVANKLNLPCNDLQCVKVTSNKYEMRKCFMEHNIPTPKFFKINENHNLDFSEIISLPAIVKPTDRSGSRGITKIEKYSQISSAVKNAIENSFEKSAIIEEYIEGTEYSCECISYEHKHYFLAVTKKYTTGSPHFIETGHIEPSGLDNKQLNLIKQNIFNALSALGIKNGASHSEFKISPDGQIKIIEIGARMGGDCIGSNLVEISTGYDFVKMVIDVSLGKKPDFSKKQKSTNAAIKFIFNELDYSMMENIEKNNKDIIIYKNKIEKIENVIDSSSRWGFYIIADEDREKLEKVLETK